MPDVEIVKLDQGGVNARILAKETKVDFRRVEAASVKMPTRFTSAEGKRSFVRMYNTLQLNMHFVSVIARTRLEHEDIARIEAAIRAQIEAAATLLNQAIDDAEALFKSHGITSAASYDTVPMDIEVHVLSSISRRFLELLCKLDMLMPLLQTLEIHEVITAQQVDVQRATLKRKVRDVANGARNYAAGLRKRMNALEGRKAGAGPAEAERVGDDAGTPFDAEGVVVGDAVGDAVGSAAAAVTDAGLPGSLEDATDASLVDGLNGHNVERLEPAMGVLQ